MADNKATFIIDIETDEGRRNLRALAAALKTTEQDLAQTEDKGHTTSTAFGTFMGNMASKAVDAALRIGQAFLRMGKDFVSSSLQIGIERDALQQGIESMLGSAEAGAIALDRLKQAALKPGVTFDVGVAGFMKLIGSGMEANAAVETIEAFGRAAAASGGGAEELARGLKAMSDMFGQGRITAQDLRLQLLQALPAIGAAFQKEFGTTSAEAIMSMVTSVEDFRERMVRAINETIPEINTLKNEIVNLKDVWLSAKESFGRGLIGDEASGQVLALTDLIRELNPLLEEYGEKIGNVAHDYIEAYIDKARLARAETRGWTTDMGSFMDLVTEMVLHGLGPLGNWLEQKLFGGQMHATSESIAALEGIADNALGFIGSTFPADPEHIPDDRLLGESDDARAKRLAAEAKKAAAAAEAAAKKAEAEALARVHADIARNTAAKWLATARGDLPEADRLERLIAEGQVILSQTTRTTLDDETGVLRANAMLQELQNRIAERERREQEQARRERLGGARDTVQQADLLRDMALLGEDENQVEARTRALTEALRQQADVLREEGDQVGALRVELQMLRLEQEKEERLTLGQEILTAGSPSGIDRLLRSKGAGLSSYTSPIGILGGALSGDFGTAVQGHESAQLKQAIGKWIGDYLVQTFAEGRLYP